MIEPPLPFSLSLSLFLYTLILLFFFIISNRLSFSVSFFFSFCITFFKPSPWPPKCLLIFFFLFTQSISKFDTWKNSNLVWNINVLSDKTNEVNGGRMCYLWLYPSSYPSYLQFLHLIFFFNFFIYLFLSLSLGLVICLFLPPACSLSISPAPVFFIQNKQNKNAHSPYQQSTQIAQGLTLLSRAAAPTTGPAQLQRRSWNESIAEKQKTRVSFKCCVWQILRLLFFTRLLTHQNACPKRPIVFSFFSPLKHWTLWTGTRSIIEFLIFFFFSFNWWWCFSFFCFSPSPIFSCLPTLTRVRIPLSKPIWFSELRLAKCARVQLGMFRCATRWCLTTRP